MTLKGKLALSPFRDRCKTPPLPRKRGRSRPLPGESNGVRCHFTQGDAVLHPLQGDLCKTPLVLELPDAFPPSRGKAAVFGVYLFKRTPVFTLSKGRGRTCTGLDPGFRRPRRKSVRGLPRNHPRITQRSPLGEGRSLPQPAPDAIRGTRSGGEDLPGNQAPVTQRSPLSARSSPRQSLGGRPPGWRCSRERNWPSRWGRFRRRRRSRPPAPARPGRCQ